MPNRITPVAIAKAAGVSENTARTILDRAYPGKRLGEWRWFEAERLPKLTDLVRDGVQRKRLNRFNAVPLDSIGVEQAK